MFVNELVLGTSHLRNRLELLCENMLLCKFPRRRRALQRRLANLVQILRLELQRLAPSAGEALQALELAPLRGPCRQ